MNCRLAVLVAIVAALPVGAAEPVAEEYQVKGAFLVNFAKFFEWPAQSFKGPADPISICILGQNPFGPALDQAIRETVVENRALVVHQVSDPQQTRQCQMVFVSASERKRSRMLLAALKGESVLTVGESEGFLAEGGVVSFRLEGEKVRFEINAKAAALAKLHISAKLLSLAQAGKR
jgi:hypothetical protein